VLNPALRGAAVPPANIDPIVATSAGASAAGPVGAAGAAGQATSDNGDGTARRGAVANEPVECGCSCVVQ
jgi:hypothetical protein